MASIVVRSDFKRGDLAGLLARIAAAAKTGVTVLGLEIENSAKGYCPVDTGTLRCSIQTSVEEQGMVVTAAIGPQVDYAPYVEFGTGVRGASSTGAGEGPYGDTAGQAAQPYMRPAFEEWRVKGPEIIREEIAGALA